MNKIIFFINCHVNKKYDSLLKIYLDDFKKSNIESRLDVKLIMVVVGKTEDYIKVRELTETHLPHMFNNYEGFDILRSYRRERIEFRVFDNSQYEHKGLETVWKEAMTSDDNDLITYTHCRGLSHKNPRSPEMNGSREVHSYLCAKCIIRDYQKIEQLLIDNPQINRVGLGQSPGGWMWFNFWTAKASYLKKRPRPLEEPRLTVGMKKHFDRHAKDRHYYEAWLGNDSDDVDSGYSLLVSPHKGVVMTGPQMLTAVNLVVKNSINKTK